MIGRYSGDRVRRVSALVGLFALSMLFSAAGVALAEEPAAKSMDVYVRAGRDDTPDDGTGDWTGWYGPLTNGQDISFLGDRPFIQYKVVFTSDGTETSVLDWVEITYQTNEPPNKPTDPSPENGVTISDNSPTLSVLVTDPDGDELDVWFYDASDDSLIGTDHVPSGSRAETQWAGLEDGTHSWYAVASDGAENTTGDVWVFTVDTSVPTPTLISPENCRDIMDNTPTFEWTSVEDPSGVTYQIEIDDDEDFSSPVYYAVGLADNWHTLPDENALKFCIHYWWHVRAVDGLGNVGEWSETWHFHPVPIAAIGAILMPLLMLLPFALMLRRQNRRLY